MHATCIVYMHASTHTSILIHARMLAYIHSHWIYSHITHTRLRHTRTRHAMYICAHVPIQVYSYTHTCSRTYTRTGYIHTFATRAYVTPARHMHCIYAHMYPYKYTHTRTHAHKHSHWIYSHISCTRVRHMQCIYAHMYHTRTHTCAHTRHMQC